MKKVINYLYASILVMALGCGDGNVVTTPDPDVQLEEDLAIIDQYIADKGYTQVDTTASGAKYVILEAGDGEQIQPNDIVSFHFILRDAEDGLIYQTSILQLAMDEDIFGETRIYEPEVMTFTNGTWFVASLSRVFTTSFAETGYKEGVIATFGQMNIGGRAEILIPSNLAFGNAALWGLDSRSVLAIEVRPVYLR